MKNQGWESKIENYLQGVSQEKFIWGKCDCLLFVCDAVKLISGIDPMSYKKEGDPDTIRGAYRNETEARLLIRKYRRSLPGIMDLHFNRVDVNFAQRGDVVTAKMETGNTFGIVWSGKAFFKIGDKGFLLKPLSECNRAWRVE